LHTARPVDTKKTAVKRVGVEKELVGDFEGIGWFDPIHREADDRVNTIHVFIELELLQAQSAAHAVDADLKFPEDIFADAFALEADFVPGDRTVAVRIKIQNSIEVMEGDIPAARYSAVLDMDSEIAVALLMGAGK